MMEDTGVVRYYGYKVGTWDVTTIKRSTAEKIKKE